MYRDSALPAAASGVSQGDYEEVVHGGGNGDSQCIVLTPASVQEEVDLMYRKPMILLKSIETL